MNVSQKCQYALRAMFELARRCGWGPVRACEIAQVQAIPGKFLELILAQLRGGGFVESRRGRGGGYLLVGRPEDLAVGRIIRFIDGPVAPVRCVAGNGNSNCPLHARCAFMGMWSRARDAVAGVYDNTTFRDLIDADQAADGLHAPTYCI